MFFGLVFIFLFVSAEGYLYDISTLIITILDINDNAPRFIRPLFTGGKIIISGRIKSSRYSAHITLLCEEYSTPTPTPTGVD